MGNPDGQITYNFEAISNLTGDMLVKWKHLNTQLEVIQKAIEPLVPTWTGTDAEAYQAQQAEWNSGQTEINSILQSLIGSANSGNERMANQEAMNRSRFQN